MYRRVLANLGFLLQISGLLTLIPIVVGVYFGENESLIAISLGCVGFLISGFLLNALCERKDLDFKSSCVFVLLSFLVMSLVGSIPYIYLDPFSSPNIAERFTNSVFESVSGFTTTGFSFISNSESLPRSFLLYRSTTELMGGVGIVFLLLVFFQSEDSLNSLGNAVGVENIGFNLKRSFLLVFLIYGAYIVLFTLLFFVFGVRDFVSAASLVIDTITGGFGPSIVYFQNVSILLKIFILTLMFVGSVNFGFNYHLMTRTPRKGLSEELRLYLSVIFVGTVLVAALSGVNLFDSLFHVVSMSSSTGFDYIGMPMLNDTVLSILILLMILGGCGFSMAGGIRMFRVISSWRSVRRNIEEIVRREGAVEDPGAAGGADFKDYSATVTILLFVFTLFVFSIVFSTIGVSFTDALFEVGSALTTNGASMGVTTATMPMFYKYLLMAAMIIGRVEIVTVLIALYVGVEARKDVFYSAYAALRSALRRRTSGQVPDHGTQESQK